MSKDKETRISAAPVKVVSGTASQKVTIRGYAASFGVVYNMGWFTEEISAQAFSTADMTDVRVLFNHNPDIILGRSRSNTARVGVNDIGFWYECDVPKSPNGKNVRIAVERGDVDQSSWGFTIAPDGDKWITEGDKPHRIITKVAMVYDASPVVYPANPATTASISTDLARQSFEATQAQKAIGTKDTIKSRQERLNLIKQRIDATPPPRPTDPAIDARMSRLAKIKQDNSASGIKYRADRLTSLTDHLNKEQ